MGETPTDTLLTDYLRYTQDSSAANKANGKRIVNHYYSMLFAQADNYSDERTKLTDLVATQRGYLLMPDNFKIKRVRVKSGNTWYRLELITDLDAWARYTAVTISGNIPTAFTIINEAGNTGIELDIVPSANASQSLEIIYEAYLDRLLFPTLVTSVGTISITNGANTITGVSTTFDATMVGRFIRPTNGKFWYEIGTYSSPTSLVTVNLFQEATITGAGYDLAELSRLPKEFDYTPIWAAVADYWDITNSSKAGQFRAKYMAELQFLQTKYKNKAHGSVKPGSGSDRDFPMWPRNYPRTRLG